MADGNRDTPVLEWAIGLLGLAVVVGSLVFLATQALSQEQPYPELRVEVTDVVRQGERYLVAFRVRNRGGVTAQNVIVNGSLATPTGVEASEAPIDYVPPGSLREGGLWFDQDPRRYPLDLCAEGYSRP